MSRVKSGSFAGFAAFRLGVTEPLAGEVDEGAYAGRKMSSAGIDGVEPALLIVVVGEYLHQAARFNESAWSEGG